MFLILIAFISSLEDIRNLNKSKTCVCVCVCVCVFMKRTQNINSQYFKLDLRCFTDYTNNFYHITFRIYARTSVTYVLNIGLLSFEKSKIMPIFIYFVYQWMGG